MREAEIRENIEKAIKMLFLKQPNIFQFTSATGQTEWNLAHHLANELHLCFQDYDCDLDVIKVNLGNRRPDIIFHKRDPHGSNFLAIQLKRDGSLSEINDDIEKVNAYWFDEPLRYEFGAVINIRGDKTYGINVFKRPLTVSI